VKDSSRSIVLGLARAGLWLALLLQTAVVAAEPRAETVTLEVAGCAESFEASLRRILVLELGDLLEPSAPDSLASGDSVRVVCDVDALRIVARSAAGKEVAHDALPHRAFPGDAAPRAAALAALEALRAVDPALAGWIQARRAEVQPPPAPEAKRAPRDAGKKENLPRATESARVASGGGGKGEVSPGAPARSRAATRLLAGGVARWLLGEPRSSAFGARLELSHRLGTPWDIGLDLEGVVTRRSVGLGTVEAKLLSSAAWFGARAFGTAFSATAALGGRFGLVELSGSPDVLARGHRVTRPFGGPLLLVRGDGTIGVLALALVFEGGLAAVGAEGLAGGAEAISLAGGWLTVSANAGVHF
jgi:hypothetical protein